MQVGKIDNWDRQYRTLAIVDTDGTIIEDKVIKLDEDVSIKKKLTNKQKDFLRCKADIQKYSKSLGGHIHMTYVKNELLFNKLNLDRANISRLIYLATYIDYNNRQENLLVKHGENYKVEPMSKKDIKYKLNLSDRTYASFIKNMKDNSLVFEVEGKFYISPEYFSKGESNFNKKEYTRIFIDIARMLYEDSTPRQHKQLGYIFQLIPFMNYELNVLCSNPKETDFTKLEKLSLRNICGILGVSTDKSSMNRLETDLLKFKITYGGDTHYVLKRIIVKGGNGKFDYFVINPQLVWAGRHTDMVKDTIQALYFNK